jgi:hypothetical protein
MPLRVVVIVEGHGEDKAIRTLLERIWYGLLSGDYIEVIPWRAKQGQLLLPQGQGLRPVVAAAAIKLHATPRADFRRLLLIMIDTEGRSENCPNTKAPELVAWAREERSPARGAHTRGPGERRRGQRQAEAASAPQVQGNH